MVIILIKMEEKKPYEKILILNSKINELKDEVYILKPEAIKELYLMGYSMDKISSILLVSKKDVMDLLHSEKIEIRKKRGRK